MGAPLIIWTGMTDEKGRGRGKGEEAEAGAGAGTVVEAAEGTEGTVETV